MINFVISEDYLDLSPDSAKHYKKPLENNPNSPKNTTQRFRLICTAAKLQLKAN